MAAFDYDKARATAERLIAKFGQKGSLLRIRSAGPDYDPVQTSEEFACSFVDLEQSQVHVADTQVQRGDRTVYLSTEGLSITPTLADKVLIGDVEHSIVDLQPLSPGGMVVFWQLQVRR
ncbi:hypothetical protein [Rhizobium lusitanum]|uniref:Uncharacterized protein n=1 Tax=Rhizobium lusitanum TaxID=293958 RepID=A0A7X0ISI2_9HYPH|nr:hypothetical protein [Rhizobium lusitanum]MBB6484861.1 hypothetical protein [Rhizobium lusitanum]